MDEHRKRFIGNGIMFLVFAIFLFLGLLSTSNGSNYEVTESDLVRLEGHLSETPKIKKTGKYNAPQLELKLLEYPETQFENFGIFYDNTFDRKVMDSLTINDLVIVSVLRYEYESKLAKIQDRSILEKIGSPTNQVSMYGIIKGNNNFVDFKSLQTDIKDHYVWRVSAWIGVIVFLFAAIFNFLRK